MLFCILKRDVGIEKDRHRWKKYWEKGIKEGKGIKKRGEIREKLNDKDSVRRAYKGNGVGSKSFKINAVLTHNVFKYNGLAKVQETFLLKDFIEKYLGIIIIWSKNKLHTILHMSSLV